MEHTEQLTLGEIASLIKQQLSAIVVADHYGFKVDHNGFCVCPFHKDSHPSLKCYGGDRGFYCYACGENGDVIWFVQKLFNLSFHGALKLISKDFSLPYFNSGLSQRERDEIKRKAERRYLELEKVAKENQRRLDDYHHWLDLYIDLDCKIMNEDPNSDEYAKAVRNIDYVEWRLEEACATCTELQLA